MNDEKIEELLRATLGRRATTVTTGPRWDVESEEVLDRPRRALRPRARWAAPLAAAAVVLAVVGGVLAYRASSSHQHPAAQLSAPAVPSGMKPVDALGVEIFVPADFAVDNFCQSRTVQRPVVVTEVRSCPLIFAPTSVRLTPREPRDLPSSAACIVTVALGDETSCIRSAPTGVAGRQRIVTLAVWWPKLQAGIEVMTVDAPLGLRIIRSAHPVAVDRNGCAATNSALLLPRGIPDPANVHVGDSASRIAPADGMSVCWYIGNRLAASGSLGANDTGAVLRAAAANAALFSPYAGGDCRAVEQSDGVELITRYADGTTGNAVLHAAACPGRDNTASPQASFVEKLGGLAGMPLSLGYPPTR